MKKPYVLTPSEVEILRLGASDPNIITDYWLRPEGGDRGFRFDENFAPEGVWQKTMHHAAQTDIVLIGGFGSGKTIGVGISACVWAMTTPWFKFLNVAPKAWQAKQMYDVILTQAANTPFEKLIWEKPRRPFHKITLKFRIENVVYESSLEFMSADRDATGILSWEGDWINIEEAGLLDNLEEVITSVGSRLRGTIRHRVRLGRLSMISNSWDNPYMWYLFDLASGNPEDYLSIVVSTRHNKNVTDDQLQRMINRIPENERQQFIDGMRPEGKGSYFAREAIYACENQLQAEDIQKGVRAGVPGYAMAGVYGAGVTYFTEPPRKGALYMLLGDPGTGDAPNRNAPALGVWDVTGCPHLPARLAAFWWGGGGGAISPFVNWLVDWMRLYQPVYTGVDSTGTQKNTAELINLQRFGEEVRRLEDNRIGAPYVSGMDFGGVKKMAYLVALRLLLEAGKLSWPSFVVGIRSQLSNYDPSRDKKIPQDIVAMMAMAAHAIRIWFNVTPEELYRQDTDGNWTEIDRLRRLDTEARSRRGERASSLPISRPG